MLMRDLRRETEDVRCYEHYQRFFSGVWREIWSYDTWMAFFRRIRMKG